MSFDLLFQINQLQYFKVCWRCASCVRQTRLMERIKWTRSGITLTIAASRPPRRTRLWWDLIIVCLFVSMMIQVKSPSPVGSVSCGVWCPCWCCVILTPSSCCRLKPPTCCSTSAETRKAPPNLNRQPRREEPPTQPMTTWTQTEELRREHTHTLKSIWQTDTWTRTHNASFVTRTPQTWLTPPLLYFIFGSSQQPCVKSELGAFLSAARWFLVRIYKSGTKEEFK